MSKQINIYENGKKITTTTKTVKKFQLDKILDNDGVITIVNKLLSSTKTKKIK